MLSTVPAAPAGAAADTSFLLENGLKVILAPQPGNPVVAAQLMVKAGSASEIGRAEQGLAHLMEHMAFKGTTRRKVGEVSSEVERNGGVINAYTSYDETVYYLTLPSDKLETAVDILSDIVFHPVYDPGEYAREKEVVIEEIRRSDDNPMHGLVDAFFRDGFGEGHPYGHRILGWAETVAEAGRDTAFAFHQRFYRPDNCVLIVTGGFDPDEARALAGKYLADLRNPAAPLRRPPAPPMPEDGPRIRILRNSEAQVPRLILGFPCPGARSPESPALDLLAALLSSGDSSRLVERVRFDKALVTQIYSSADTLLEGGLFVINFETAPDRIMPALEATLDELNSLSSDPPRADELARARALATKSFVDRQEAPASASGLIGNFELYTGDYRLKDAYLNIWSRIAPADLSSLASRIFRAPGLTVTVLLPEDAPALDEGAVLAAAARLSPAASGKAAAREAAPFEALTLRSGARLFVLRDATLPLVEIKAAVMGGRLAEPRGKEGLASLVSAVWARATERRAAPELSRAIEDLGSSVSGSSGRNTLSLDGSFLSSGWREGLALFAEVLTAPAFAPADFERRKEEHLTYLKSLEESLVDRLFRIARRELFRDHPYSVDSQGTYASVAGLTREDALSLYQELVRPESLVFAVAGDVTAQEAAAALDGALDGWTPPAAAGGADAGTGDGTAPAAAGSPAGPGVAVPPAPPALEGPVMASEALDRAQTHIAVSFLAPGMGTPDQAALEVLDSVLSGMGGVLFTELRDKKSLAYTVTSTYGQGLGAGSFSFYIGCAPEKTAEALSGILAIIREARDREYDAEIVGNAKAYLAGTNKIHRQTLGSRVNDSALFDLYGLGQDRNERLLEEVAAVTPADVRRVAGDYLALDRAVLAVVGNEASIKAAEGLFQGFRR
jgi:zinc protease